MHLIIKGKNIYLRNLILKDVSRKYLDWLSDNEINQYLETRHHKQSLSLIKKFINDCKKNNSLLMAICIKKNQKHIGNIKIGPINKFHKTADISYFIGDKEEWGKGYATNAIKLMSDFAVNNLGLNTLVAGCYEENLGSYRAFVKANWKYVGRIPNYWKTIEGYRSDEILLSFEK